jgi:hypothetical protein
MATPQQIAPLLYAQMTNDALAQVIAAGNDWATFPMGFYYSDEVSVDIAVKATMLRVLKVEHATLPGDVWGNLSGAVNRATKVSDTLTIMSQASSAAIHHPV